MYLEDMGLQLQVGSAGGISLTPLARAAPQSGFSDVTPPAQTSAHADPLPAAGDPNASTTVNLAAAGAGPAGQADNTSQRSVADVTPSEATVGAGAPSSATLNLSQRPRRTAMQKLNHQQGYTPMESTVLLIAAQERLLQHASPREIKRLLNHYRIAKCVLQQQEIERQYMEVSNSCDRQPKASECCA